MSFEDENAVPSVEYSDGDYNKSGMGSVYPVPDIVADKFNWGACLLTWIWGLGNRTYITLLIFFAGCSFIAPFAGWIITLVMQIWFGIKGNEWAWQNKRFESIEAFHRYQRKWAAAGIILTLVTMLIVPMIILMLTIPVLKSDTTAMQNNQQFKKIINDVENAVLLNETMDEKCELTSSGLAECFANRMNGSRAGNMVFADNDIVYTFESNGICENKGDCKVKIKFGENSKDGFNLSLYVKPNGCIYLNKTELDSLKNK